VEIRTLRHVGVGKTCGGVTAKDYYDTRWLTGIWSAQVMVEGIVLKVTWH
jgi:hypothetical protein